MLKDKIVNKQKKSELRIDHKFSQILNLLRLMFISSIILIIVISAYISVNVYIGLEMQNKLEEIWQGSDCETL